MRKCGAAWTRGSQRPSRARMLAHFSGTFERWHPTKQLMFSGHNACRSASDLFPSNRFIPTVKQLTERIVSGR